MEETEKINYYGLERGVASIKEMGVLYSTILVFILLKWRETDHKV